MEIIDEHKSFWRTLHLPEDSLRKWDHSILELFDRKSGSTLKDVDIGVEVGEEHQAQIIRTLKKSKAHLKHLFLKTKTSIGLEDLLVYFSAVESLRLPRLRDASKVRLRRRPNKRDSREEGSTASSPLKVLWYGTNQWILVINSPKFENSVSLDSGAFLTASEWREFLEGPSRNLKHLKLGFKSRDDEDHSGVPTLYFPSLEVLELYDAGDFPLWLLIPESTKLIAHSGVVNIPSISEFWSWTPVSHRNDITNRLPNLDTLCLGYVCDLKDVVEMLTGRKANFEAGLQVDGVKMEMMKTLVVPFSLSDPDLPDKFKRNVRRCRELVERVEGDSDSRFIEVEV